MFVSNSEELALVNVKFHQPRTRPFLEVIQVAFEVVCVCVGKHFRWTMLSSAKQHCSWFDVGRKFVGVYEEQQKSKHCFLWNSRKNTRGSWCFTFECHLLSYVCLQQFQRTVLEHLRQICVTYFTYNHHFYLFDISNCMSSIQFFFSSPCPSYSRSTFWHFL